MSERFIHEATGAGTIDADARAIVRRHASAVLQVSEVGTSGIESRDSVDPTETIVRSLVSADPYI
jgi:hypothetical protein